MNRAVSNKEVKGFYLKIKTVQNSRLIGTVYSDETNIDYNSMMVSFQWDFNNHLNIGQHYKIQIAYVNTYGDVGHYSTVGVVKYTSKPKVEIQDLVKKKDNVHRYSYLGVYAQERSDEDSNEIIDVAEKLYSYCFNLYDVAGNLIHTSDWQIHNSTQDTEPNMAICSYVLNKELDENQKYYIEFEIITSNELHDKSGKYSLIQKKSVSPNVDFDLVVNAEKEIENGGIVVGIRDNKEQSNQKNKILRTGSFKLIRTDEESAYAEWNEILAFKLFNQEAPYTLFTDYTVKQGVKYKYAVVQHNEYGLQSNKIESDIISSNFDYIYLYDGKRQLKIKYNPKISSFKEVLLESKIDTIGSKHPFIFRNGNVEYKEFPISGLITTLMDENYLFFSNHLEEKIKDRKYEDLYEEIPVSREKIYYYQEDWEILFCKFPQQTAMHYQSIRDYCKDNNKLILQGYDNTLDYAIRQRNPKYDEKNPNLHEKFLYTKVKVSNIKYYLYSEVKNDLYIKYQDKHIKIDPKAQFDENERYFVLKVKTKNKAELFDSHFTNNYDELSIHTERDFKLEVLDWLNNGKPKLFRSPTEGNYIVRLMNSSLAPNDQLGRVLHTFNSTAYEVEEYNFNNLIKNDFIFKEEIAVKTIRWETVLLDKAGIGSQNNLIKYKAKALKFEGMIPGDRLYINDGILRPTGAVYEDGTFEMREGYTIIIGATGSYNLALSDNIEISQVKFDGSYDNILADEKRTQHQGTLTYAYENTAFTSFDTIENFSVEITPLQQFFGKYDNIINEINNIKNQLQEIYFIHAVLRDEIKVYANDGKYYSDENYKNEIELNNRYCIYKIKEGDNYSYYDAYHFKSITLTSEDIKNGDMLYLNSKEIKIFRDNDFFIKYPENLKIIETGYRVLLEICYQSTVTTYGAEKENTYVKNIYEDYLKAEELYLTKKNSGSDEVTVKETYQAYEAMNRAYKTYIVELEKELERQGGIEGELVES